MPTDCLRAIMTPLTISGASGNERGRPACGRLQAVFRITYKFHQATLLVLHINISGGEKVMSDTSQYCCVILRLTRAQD